MMTQRRTIPGIVMTLAFGFVLLMASVLGPDVAVGSTAEQALQQAQDPPPPVPEDGEPAPPAPPPAAEPVLRRQVFPSLESYDQDHAALSKLKDELEQADLAQSPAQPLAAPAHDDFNNAKTISALPYSDTDNTAEATVAFDDPNFPCGSATTPTQSNTVWYEYTAPSAGQLHVDTFGSDYDTVLAVWTGNRGSLANIACNDDSVELQSAVEFPITADETYYIEVGDYGAPGGGDLVLNVTAPAASLGWAERRDLPNDRDRLAVVSDGAYIYAIGGQEYSGGYQESPSNQRYYPATDSWTNRAPMLTAYSNMDAAYLGGNIYIPAGYSGGNYLGTHYVYSTTTDAWDTATAAPWASTTITPVIWYAAAADPTRNVYYLTGGYDGGSPTGVVLRYNVDVGDWTVLPPLLTARFGHEATVIDGLLYVAGGVDASFYSTTSAEVYAPDLDSWSSISSMVTDRVFAANASGVMLEQPIPEWGNGTPMPGIGNYRTGSVSDDCERIWVFGGGVDQDDVMFYNSSSDTWTTGKTPVPNEGMGWQAVHIDGKIYLAGGWTIEPAQHNDWLQIYDIAANSWSDGAVMPSATTPMAAAANGKLYIFGGNNPVPTNPPLNNVAVYDPASNIWTPGLAPMPTARAYGRAIAIDDMIYVVGGWTNGASAFERYDPVANSWDVGSPLNTARSDMSLFAVGDYLYASGGLAGDWYGLTTVERYYLPGFPSAVWETMSPAPEGFGAAAYGCASDKMWSIGGVDEANALSTINHYQDENLPCSCTQAGVSKGDGKWYIAGGGFSSRGNVLRTVEAYDPGSDTWALLDPSLYNLNQARRLLGGAATSSGSFYVTGGFSPYPGPDGDLLSEKHEVMIEIHQNLLPAVLRDFCAYQDPYEPNNQLSQAYPIQSNVTYRGNFACSNDDVDLFQLQLTATGTIQAWLTHIPLGSNFTLALYNDSSKVPLIYSGQPGNADEYVQATSQPAGTYYLQIFNQGGTYGTNVTYDLRAAY